MKSLLTSDGGPPVCFWSSPLGSWRVPVQTSSFGLLPLFFSFFQSSDFLFSFPLSALLTFPAAAPGHGFCVQLYGLGAILFLLRLIEVRPPGGDLEVTIDDDPQTLSFFFLINCFGAFAGRLSGNRK